MSEPELNAALAKAQGEFEAIEKSKEVRFGDRSYKYAPLDEIFKKCLPVLSRNGLSVTQLLEGGENGPGLRTELRHAAGGVVGSTFPLPTLPQKPQELGSVLTYLRRYALIALLGIAPEDDDDDGEQANQATGEKPKPRKRAPAKPPIPPSQEQQDAFYKPDTITEPQMKKLQALFHGHEIEDREERLTYVNGVIERPVESSKDLTKTEASALIEHLEAFDRNNPQTYPFPAAY